ncbi:hypothetical protein OIV83_003613 [Microbotryomycetes sp. JL201]|nr:hypothetical protein OIV83_003613 [Microbotryomycetes sp. JL201]
MCVSLLTKAVTIAAAAVDLCPAGASASPNVALSRGAIQRLELLHSLDLTLWILFIVSYILSPSHLLTFILRLTSQAQFGAPRLVHPTRSLRFFFVACTFINASAIVVHSLDGSQGTKGSSWIATPSTIHLILLDLSIAVLQFLVIIIAFAEQPSQLALQIVQARFQGDLPPTRDYSSLLGSKWNQDDSIQNDEDSEIEEEDDDDDDGIRFESVFDEYDEAETDDFKDNVMFDSTYSPLDNSDSINGSATSTSRTSTRLRKRSNVRTKSFIARTRAMKQQSRSTALIDIRWENLWRELKSSSGADAHNATTTDVDVERMEEGRSGAG